MSGYYYSLLAVVLLSACGCQGFGMGAPACVEQPKHDGISPQTSQVPYALSLQKSGSNYVLTVGSPGGDTYKGILIRTAQSGELIPQTEGFKQVTEGCDAYTNAWTHTLAWKNNPKSVSSWIFTPATGATVSPTFKIHIAKNYGTFWTNIEVA